MGRHSNGDTVQVKYHGYSNWTHWVEAETRQSTALYLSTNIGMGAAIRGISNIDLTLIFLRIGINVSVPRIEPPPPSDAAAGAGDPRRDPGDRHPPLRLCGHPGQEEPGQVRRGKETIFPSLTQPCSDEVIHCQHYYI